MQLTLGLIFLCEDIPKAGEFVEHSSKSGSNSRVSAGMGDAGEDAETKKAPEAQRTGSVPAGL